MSKMRQRWWLVFAVLVAVFPAASQAAHLRGCVVRVGFRATDQDSSDQGTDHYRPGHWTPVEVELTNDEGDLFDGVIEVRQADRDGDEIVARRRVTVRGTERFFLYIPASAFQNDVDMRSGVPQASAPFAVRVFDADGKLAPLFDTGGGRINALVPLRRVVEVANEDLVVLDISERPVNQLSQLVSDIRLFRRLVVARSSPLELPENADGLDLADIIVWDAADPSRFTDPAQGAALLEWTRRGGKLVIGVSKNWQLVAKSVFGDALPARLTDVATTTRVPELEPYLFDTDNPFEKGESWSPPLNYCPVTINMLAADAGAVLPENPTAADRLFVTRRLCGRGEIVLVSAELREIMAKGKQNEKLLRQVLGLRLKPASDRETPGRDLDLFRPIESLTGFQLTVQVYIIFAFLFVVAYIAAVTGGSWFWLRRKGMVHYAWSAFAIIAIVASGISLGAVQLIRGIGQRVQELSIVDVKAGSLDASATSYFGLKTASHLSLDLCVPANWLQPEDAPEARGSIRPLPADRDLFGQSVYSAMKQYEVVAPVAELRSVPFRATVKQFEAAWRGRLAGRVSARLQRSRLKPAELTSGSWVENNLGTNLEHCFLFVRSARSSEVVVYPLGRLETAKRVTCEQAALAMQEASKQYEERFRGRSVLRDRTQLDPEQQPPWSLPELTAIHLKCLSELGMPTAREDGTQEYLQIGGEGYVKSLLVLSTYDELNEQRIFGNKESAVSRSQGQRLDRSSWLSRDMALLVGFSRDAGPARLCIRSTGGKRWRVIQPETARVMYRVAIPIENR